MSAGFVTFCAIFPLSLAINFLKHIGYSQQSSRTSNYFDMQNAIDLLASMGLLL